MSSSPKRGRNNGNNGYNANNEGNMSQPAKKLRMNGIGVISYNMSVFSAMGDKVSKFASEFSFLQRAAAIKGIPSDFFMNALGHLKENAVRIDAKVIGIQEFHPPTLKIIMDTLDNKNYTYHVFSKEITNNASVLTIWDQDLLGYKVGDAYDEDLGLTEGVAGLLPNDKGRPISIIKTTNGYALINFHGINRPRYYGEQPKDGPRPAGQEEGVETGVDNSDILKDLISKHAAAAGLNDIAPEKIIIMCDSNDREHAINSETPLIIKTSAGDVGFHDDHLKDDKSAISCCYNWDSCGIPKSGGKTTLGDAGAEINYAYTGDYVLSSNFIKSVTAVESPLDGQGASIASDHKLVYAILPMPMAGGRRKMRKTRKSKARKSKKSRKH